MIEPGLPKITRYGMSNKDKRVFFSRLDWTKNNCDLARELSMTSPAIRYWRLKFKRKPHKRGNPHRI